MDNQYADLGFEEDVGFVPADDHSDVGFVEDPQDAAKKNPMEMKLYQEKEAQAVAQQQAQQQAQAEAAAKADPKNWTLKQTQEHFKDNPPQNPIQEAQSKILLDTKKQELKQNTEQISQAKPPTFKQVVSDLVHTFWTGDTPESRGIRADRAAVMAHMFDVPLSVISKNYEQFARMAKFSGDEGQMGAKKILSAMALPPITAAAVANPLAAGLALGGFAAMGEGENALISAVKGEKYQFMRGLSAKDLAPEEAAPVTKDMIDIAEFIAQMGIGVGMFHGANAAAPPGTKISEVPTNVKNLMVRFGKDFVTNYKLPKEMYLPTVSGEDVKVPTEDVIKAAQGENWKHIKDELSVAPTPKEEIAAKKEAHQGAMTEQAKKDLNFVEEDPVTEKPKDQGVAVAEGSDTSKPSQPSRAIMPEGTGTKEPSTNLETLKSPPGSSTRYVVPSSSMNLDAITNLQEKTTILRGESQANADAFTQHLKDATGVDPDVRVKSPERLSDKLAQYEKEGRSARDVADVLGGRVIVDQPQIQKQLVNVHKNFDVLDTRDYFAKPSDFGYKGINMKVKLPNGQLAEVQLHTPESVAKSVPQHKLYEKWSAKDQAELTPKEKLQLHADMKEAQRIGNMPLEDFKKEFNLQGPPPDATETAPGGSGGLKERKFITSVREDPKTAPEVAKAIKGDYQPISNEQTLAEAKDRLATDPNAAQAEVEGPAKPTRVSNTVAQLLIDKAQNEGRIEDAIRIVEKTAEKNTAAGQAIQALSMYARLTPEGILRFAHKQLEVAGVKVDPKFGEELVARAKKLKEIPEGRDKDIETALILKEIADRVPASALKKISMLQTMAQLLNLKTMIRNLLGNIVFMGAENLSGSIGTALDVGLSLATGRRTHYMPSLIEQTKGLVKGFKEGTQESLLGINLKNLNSKFDLPKGSVFNSGVMKGFEKALSVSLGATDRAFYQAAFNDSIRQQIKAGKVAEATPEMIEKAHFEGLYRTFQDDNVISRTFETIKKGFNYISPGNIGKTGSDIKSQDWGLGDMVIKYPKTPGAIMSRGIEYSPFGFINTAMRLVSPVVGKGFNQEAFVKETARALTGSAVLVGSGFILAQLGVITGKRVHDKDAAAALQGVGIREYQINVDGLKRLVASGFDPEQAKMQPGDTLATYDWMQPASISLAIGANMALAKDKSAADKIVNMADRVFEASETLASQPLVQGLKVLTGRQSISEGIAATIQGIPASFVPTLLSQVRQFMDNQARNTKDPNYYKTMGNMALNKIPGADKGLPPKLNPLGQPQELYQLGSNNPFNVFLNPSFVSKYNPDPISNMVLDIWQHSGQTAQFPRVASAKIKVGTEQIEMDPAQYNEFQSYIGTKTQKLFGLLAESNFVKLPYDYQAKKLQGLLTDINTAAKIEVLGYRPEKNVHQDVLTIMQAIGKSSAQIKKQEAAQELDFVEGQ